eukprot:899945-Rhodomonas_salina.2
MTTKAAAAAAAEAAKQQKRQRRTTSSSKRSNTKTSSAHEALTREGGCGQVSPNYEHVKYAQQWIEAYPDAVAYGWELGGRGR